MEQTEIDEMFMYEALKLACIAEKKGEVPIGAVIVKDGKIISKGYNLKETKQMAINHAEILAIKNACKKLRSWRLEDCTLYVTLEPCPMCSGAIINSRITRIVFGAFDKKAGCCGTLYNLPLDERFNHRPIVMGGILENDCGKILSNFFKNARENKGRRNVNNRIR